MNRRSLLKSLAKAAAIIAMAPQLAFRVKPERFDAELLDTEKMSFWNEPHLISMCYTDEYLEWFKRTDDMEAWKRGEGPLFVKV